MLREIEGFKEPKGKQWLVNYQQNIKFDLAFLANVGIDFSNANYDTWELSSILFPPIFFLNFNE